MAFTIFRKKATRADDLVKYIEDFVALRKRARVHDVITAVETVIRCLERDNRSEVIEQDLRVINSLISKGHGSI